MVTGTLEATWPASGVISRLAGTATPVGATVRPLILNANTSTAARVERSRVLIEAGFEVSEAAGGAEALSVTMKMLPDLILMNVPVGRDDSDLWRELRSSQARNVPLLLTCAPGYFSQQQSTRPADAWLPDPVDPYLLVPIIRTLLRHGSSEREERESGLVRWGPSKARKNHIAAGLGQGPGHDLPSSGSAKALARAEDRRSPIAHDLLSPLATISAVAGWIIGEYGKALDENGREYLILLEKSIERMHRRIYALFGDKS